MAAAFDDAGGGLARPVSVVGYGGQSCDGFAVARDGQALARRGAVKQSG